MRLALRQASSELWNATSIQNGRILHHSLKNRKTVDTENTKHQSEAQNDGKLLSQTTTTTEHEEVGRCEMHARYLL